jgi:hypothetical protein
MRGVFGETQPPPYILKGEEKYLLTINCNKRNLEKNKIIRKE